jgi:bifunctional non-homologous end joining protein LigD
VTARAVRISNPDKMLFPDDGITKADLAAYYETVASAMVPHLKNRPLMLQRFPNGLGREGWIQQDVGRGYPDWMPRVTVPKTKGTVTHAMVTDTPSLVYLANLNSITLHEWLSRADKIEKPDLMIIDLDPGPDATFADVRKAARATRALLDELDLPAYLKTSGSKGLHVAVPLKRRDTFEQVHETAAILGDVLAARAPEQLTTEFRKEKRKGRLFLDMHRNQYGQHVVAPYTVRALPGAPVSSPIDWDELGRVEAQTFTLKNVPKRLERVGDPWKDMKARAVTLGRARKLLEQMSQNG